MRSEANLSLGCFRCSSDRAIVTSLTNPHYDTAQVIFIFRPLNVYSRLEILILPLAKDIWIGIIILKIIEVTFILYSYKFQRKLFNFVSPHSYGVALMNSLAVFLGLPIKDLTRRNFSRYLLFMWIIFTFIIRNSYSARLFDLMTVENSANLPQGFSDLLRMGYKFFMTESTYGAVKGVRKASKLEVETIRISDEMNFLEYMLKHKEIYRMYAGVTPEEFIRLYVVFEGYEDDIYILPHIVYKQQLCIYFSKHSCLVRRIDNILLRLRSMGLIFYWAQKSFRHKQNNIKTRNDADEALDLNEMSGILYVMLSGLLLSGLVFIYELVSGRYKLNKRS